MRTRGGLAAMGLGSLLVAACGGGTLAGGGKTATTTNRLMVNSTTPSAGVAVQVSPADVHGASNGSSSFTRTYDTGTTVTLTAPTSVGGSAFTSWAGCSSFTTVTSLPGTCRSSTRASRSTTAPPPATTGGPPPTSGWPCKTSRTDHEAEARRGPAAALATGPTHSPQIAPSGVDGARPGFIGDRVLLRRAGVGDR